MVPWCMSFAVVLLSARVHVYTPLSFGDQALSLRVKQTLSHACSEPGVQIAHGTPGQEAIAGRALCVALGPGWSPGIAPPAGSLDEARRAEDVLLNITPAGSLDEARRAEDFLLNVAPADSLDKARRAEDFLLKQAAG